ncbi:MAG: hypothetical protein EPN82_13400 [Bacteroidetes bacterium]|nr:MAG: hypothetical protein EPN82_13400 [Bacteroidota bacterium]
MWRYKSLQSYLILHLVIIISAGLTLFYCISKANDCTGNSTYLQIKILSLPKHDKSDGETMLLLHSQKDSSVLKEIKLDGIWHCIGFNPELNKYILGGMFQVGGWLPMCEIRYLAETNFEMKSSQINKTEWFSFIAVPDESLKYICLIGKYDEKYMVLFVLNTITDRVQILGNPPQPPPVDSSFVSEDFNREEWQWGSSYADGFTVMDEGIIVFKKNDKLCVSIGKDTPLKRSSKRKNIIYKLTK